MKKISPDALVAMDEGGPDAPWQVDLAYARDDNLLFGERIYRKDARLWLHRDLAKVVKEAAQICRDRHGCKLIIHDGLRTFEAQARMLTTQKVKDNMHWIEGTPRLLSPPGAGGHPRGMAVDVSLVDAFGVAVDMGTPFDYLSEDASPEGNPAHRRYVHLKPEHRENRLKLDDSMHEGAKRKNVPLVGLDQEWWDYRLLGYEEHDALKEADLRPEMKMMD